MFGNPKWFKIRKYTGWGLTPVTWQGWLYVLVFIFPVAIISSLSLNLTLKNTLILIWMGLLILDVIHIMSQIKQDERERLHEAIADRNALWFIIFVLIIGIFIKQVVDPIIIIAILGAALIKTFTHFYLRDK